MLYPHGLHVLLTGPPVGKTFCRTDAPLCLRTRGERPPPLVYFNCAEYAHNPELLSSHLFGHRQGPLPAPVRIKPVWWSRRTAGICCLMKCAVCLMKVRKTFSILDKGEYRPLGSSAVARSISVSSDMCHYRTGKFGVAANVPETYSGMYRSPGIRQRSVESRLN